MSPRLALASPLTPPVLRTGLRRTVGHPHQSRSRAETPRLPDVRLPPCARRAPRRGGQRAADRAPASADAAASGIRFRIGAGVGSIPCAEGGGEEGAHEARPQGCCTRSNASTRPRAVAQEERADVFRAGTETQGWRGDTGRDGTCRGRWEEFWGRQGQEEEVGAAMESLWGVYAARCTLGGGLGMGTRKVRLRLLDPVNETDAMARG